MAEAKQLRQWGRRVIDIEKQALDNLYQFVDSPSSPKPAN